MKIQEVITILEDLTTTLPQVDPELRRQAIRLAIQALGLIKNHSHHCRDFLAYLSSLEK